MAPTPIATGLTAFTPRPASGADFYESAIFLNYGGVERADAGYGIHVSGLRQPARAARRTTSRRRAPASSALSGSAISTPIPRSPGGWSNAIRAIAVVIDPSVDFIFSTGDVLSPGGQLLLLDEPVCAELYPGLHTRQRGGQPRLHDPFLRPQFGLFPHRQQFPAERLRRAVGRLLLVHLPER